MKVKIGDTVYDGERVPVMVILSDADKMNIINMSPECTKYAAFPDGSLQSEIERWMAEVPAQYDCSVFAKMFPCEEEGAIECRDCTYTHHCDMEERRDKIRGAFLAGMYLPTRLFRKNLVHGHRRSGKGFLPRKAKP